jgi:formylglycine-generating enzyme required for sulfatase activity
MASDRDHYLTDYWTTEDTLRFSDFRPALFNILTQAQTPLTVGVFGPWGSGKTSLLRMLKEDVETRRSPSLRAVWFTAWKYDRHEALWRALILRVLDALYPREPGDTPWEERARIPVDELHERQAKHVNYLNRLSDSLYRPVTWEEKGGWTLAWDDAGKEIAKFPAFLLLSAAGSGKIAESLGITPDMAKLLKRQVQAQRLDQVTSMEQFEATFRDALAEILEPDGRLVVFVDDLDRCLPEKAIEVLEAIKLFLEVPGTAFVLGMDRAVIERGIEARYRAYFRHEGDERAEFPISGASYLQKIVQIPFHLPPLAVDDVGTYIAALEKELPNDARLSETMQEVFAHGLLPNPRQTKRALNIFRLLKEIAETREMKIAWPLLAKTVLIQTQWPRLYADWRQYPTLVQTLEAAYARQPFSEREAIQGRAALTVEGESAPVRREADDEAPEAGGLLAPYLRERRTYALLERMLAFPAPDEAAADAARFAGLGREQIAAYVRLAGAVGTEEQPVAADIATDLWPEMLSGDPVRIQDATARLDEEEPQHEGPQHRTYRARLQQVMRDPEHPAKERVSAGDALAQLGDPRFRADAWYLPDEPLLGFVEIPEGPFVMGSDPQMDKQAYDDEHPQHERELSPYYIACYPVTVAQFRAFVQASEYKPDTERCLEGVDNHPVVDVTWHDAAAYCRWLTERLQTWKDTPEPLATLLREKGWVITLSSEAQWEKAARGPLEGRNPGRIFPWGNDPDPNQANYERTIGRTSTVGCFPGGASPYDIEDLSGNVWEWTRTQWQENYAGYQPDLPVDDGAVVRGGAFDNIVRFVRCAYRNGDFPGNRHGYLGIRVVCGVPHPSEI